MFRKIKILWIKKNISYISFVIAVFAAGVLTACGQEQGNNVIDLSEMSTFVSDKSGITGEADGNPTPENNEAGTSAAGTGASADQTGTSTGPDRASAGQAGTSAAQAGAPSDRTQTSTEIQTGGSADNSWKTPEDAAGEEYIKGLFGDNCIVGQTFEVELSAYNGKVWFVPYAPSADNKDFHIQIVQDGEVLEEITAYVPDDLAGKKFSSLDAVAFFDINYDDITDILLIETYGDATFAAVYYGCAGYYRSYFLLKDQLSETISDKVETLTIPAIRSFLSNGKKNGEFSDYQEAYRAVSRLYDMEGSNERKYDLIYIDDDDTPELVAAVNGYYMNLYTYSQGKVYTLMDYWGYGAMGNSGYAYVPERNSLRNYNTDYAGAILYTTYMEVSRQKTIEISVEIKTYNFDDVNGNGVPDGDELEASLGNYSVSYVEDREITEEEWSAYEKGEYEYIEGKMSLEQLLAKWPEH